MTISGFCSLIFWSIRPSTIILSIVMCLFLCLLGFKMSPKLIEIAMFKLFCEKQHTVHFILCGMVLVLCDESKTRREIYSHQKYLIRQMDFQLSCFHISLYCLYFRNTDFWRGVLRRELQKQFQTYCHSTINCRKWVPKRPKIYRTDRGTGWNHMNAKVNFYNLSAS